MRYSIAISLVALGLTGRGLVAGPLIITTGKIEGTRRHVPLEFEIRGVPADAFVALEALGTRASVPCQVVERSGANLRVAWLAPVLPDGTEAMWQLGLLRDEDAADPDRVVVKQVGDSAVSVTIDGKEFTTLLGGKDQSKPYLYPIVGPNGKPITRRYPMEKGVPGEDQDHPHHRSLWFDHGKVGGADFWLEGPGKGTIRQVAVERLESGPVFGKIVTANEWIAPDGKKILDDRRTFTIWALGAGETLLDVRIVLSPAAGAVKFGDTKEGSFGIRLAESMKEARGGTIVNSRGQKGSNEAWGKPAEWVDCHGPVGGDTVGVAILDHPTSFRHPTTWHVRDYGLFAANPFGYRAFEYGSENGDYDLEPGKTLELRYRVYFHHGDEEEAGVAQVYRGFAEPPALHPKGTPTGTPVGVRADPPAPKLSAEASKDEIVVRVDGEVFTRYKFGDSQKYPWLYPLVGPRSGRSVTTESSEPYPHHHSLFFGCDRVNGGNYWQEGLERGRIDSVEAKVARATESEVVIEDRCRWVRPGAPDVIEDTRRWTVTAPRPGERRIEAEIQLTALVDVRVEKTNHSLFSARVEKELAPAGGGVLVSSEGDRGEKATFGKKARWCAFSGTREGVAEGLAIIDHPGNPWAPTPWFTRDYGFISPTPMFWLGPEGWRLEKGKSVQLRYLVVIHEGATDPARLDAIAKDWAK